MDSRFRGNDGIFSIVVRATSEPALVVMPAVPMNVPVLALFIGRRTYVDDLDRKVQRLASHRMIEVDVDDAGTDLDHRYRPMAFLRAQHRAHSRLQPVAILEVFLRHALREVVAAQSVGLLRCNNDIETVAGSMTFDRLLEPGDDRAMPEQDHEWLAFVRTVDDRAGIIGQVVVKRNDVVFFCLHRPLH